MKIAIHQPRVSYYVGGGEIVPLEQAAGLSTNHKITIVTSKYKESDVFKAFKKNNPQIRVEYFQLPDKIYKEDPGQNQLRWDTESIAFGKATIDYYVQNNFDLIVSHYTTDALLLPKKNILHLHGFPHKYRDLNALALMVPMGFVSVSKFVTENWKSMHNINNINLCYNGVNEAKFVPKKTDKKFDILYLGRLIKIKGIDDLIHSLENVKSEIPNLRVLIGGKGPDEPRLKHLTSRLSLTNNIEFCGYIPEENLVDIYNKAKICVFPSYAREGVLTTLLEASSCGTPSITANCCGMKEFVKDKVNGMLFKPRNIGQLSSLIIESLTNQKLRDRLGKNARKEIVTNWTWKKRIKELESIYLKYVT